MARVEEKVALITGGASGLGAASARVLAREGAKIAISDLQDAAGDALAAELRDGGAEAIYLHHEVTDEDAWISVVEEVITSFGRLDILLNSAGISGGAGGGTPIAEASLEHFRHVIEVNLDGTFLGVKHALRNMSAGGSIINISSIAGLIGLPGAGAYTASKGGVKLLTQTAALECCQGKNGIRVNSIHPGFIDTPMVQDGIQRSEGVLLDRIRSMQPGGEMGRPEDIANAVLFLASDEARFVNGSQLVVDGAYTAR